MKTGVPDDPPSQQTLPDKTLSADGGNDRLSVMAHRLAFLVQESPDVALVIDAWPTLPEAVKAGVIAMVEAAGNEAP